MLSINASPHNRKTLVVFARYPRAGRCKTRLIPALGEDRAAQLHNQMVQHTLDTARQLRERVDVRIVVYGTDAEPGELSTWCGPDLHSQLQSQGDLGQRLRDAVQGEWSRGSAQVMVIGTDCPALSVDLLQRAWALLESHPVVVGPADDGGYYLIGLQQPHQPRDADFVAEVFRAIDWGTSSVLTQTLSCADRYQLPVGILPKLPDVDRPEDIAIWETVQQAQPTLAKCVAPRLAVIIPTLDNEPLLAAALASASGVSGVELIVVAAGDVAAARRLAIDYRATCLTTRPGRAQQLNDGALIADSPHLLFLHADTRLPSGFLELVAGALGESSTSLGAFALRIDGPGRTLRWIEWGANLRARWMQLPYGDQALFMRRSTWQVLGRFPEQPLMEDYEFVRRARRVGKVVLITAAVVTSARRWQRLGPWQTTLLNQLLLVGYQLGVPTPWLARCYRRPRPPVNR